MRILFVTPFYPPDKGGIADHVHELVRIISKRHEVSVVTNVPSTSLQDLQEDYVIRIPSITPPSIIESLSSFRIPLMIKPLIKRIDDFQPNIIHAHGHHYPITWLAASIAKIKRIPFVMTLHGMYALYADKSFMEEVFNHTIFKWLILNSNAIIALTPTMVSYVRKYGPVSRIFVIPNGIDLKVYLNNRSKKFEYRKKYGLNMDKIIVLYRGRFVGVKGFSEFVDSIAMLNCETEIRNRVLFLLIGAGPLKDYAVQKISNYDNVVIFDWIPEEKKHELYIASDILVLPSKWYEAFSIVALEGMAAGLYLIVSQRGSLPDVTKGYARKAYLNSISPRDIANCLRKVILNWSELSSIEVNYEYLMQYDWTNVVENLLVVYEQILHSERIRN